MSNGDLKDKTFGWIFTVALAFGFTLAHVAGCSMQRYEHLVDKQTVICNTCHSK